MTDRELLELAAKAAGIDGAYFDNDNPICCGIYQARGEYYWNPLISDSEALRLAVKLKLIITWAPGMVVVDLLNNPMHFAEPLDAPGCDAEATRRAIVRAAAMLAERGKG